jgi:ABC-type multidrug transport system fused ATPase/permease subunit
VEDGPPKEIRSFVEVMHPDGSTGTWRDLPRLMRESIRLVWEASPRVFLLTASLQIVAALGIAVQLFVFKYAFDAVLNASKSDFASVLPSLALLVGVSVILDLIRAIEGEQSRVLGELVGRRALDRVIDVAQNVDLLAFEEPDFYDRLRRAQAQGMFRALQTVNAMLGIVGAAVASVGIVLALAGLQPALLPIVFLGYVPLWIASSRNTRDYYQFSFGMTHRDRERSYLQQLLLARNSAKEIRAFQLAPFLRARYDRLYDERIAELKSVAWRRTARSLVASLASAGLVAIAVAGLAWLYVSGRMDLASVGAAVFGLYQLNSRLQAMHFSASALYESTLFIRDYTSFLALGKPEPKPTRPAPDPPGTIELERVRFTYPGSERPALDDVSIRIEPGEIVALVGENGSGKTTLAKVIAGLFAPQAGQMTWAGTDTQTVDPETMRARIAVIFQDFERYLFSVADNIAVGRHERQHDMSAIEEAAERAGVDRFVGSLAKGYDTMLGREFFGGYDLSIGQWQRLALARAFFRDASLVILDEPTAALDARAESALFDRMRELLEGRAAVLISHRFSSVRSADRIYVLDGGHVVEHGTHDELMSLHGIYAELFTLQATQYASVP